MDVLERIQAWHKAQVERGRDPTLGVRIETLRERPGWSVQIDLAGTQLSGLTLAPYKEGATDRALAFRIRASRTPARVSGWNAPRGIASKASAIRPSCRRCSMLSSISPTARSRGWAAASSGRRSSLTAPRRTRPCAPRLRHRAIRSARARGAPIAERSGPTDRRRRWPCPVDAGACGRPSPLPPW